MVPFIGAGVALITPFSKGKIDFETTNELIEWQIEQGIDAIISCGTTGEASTLTDEEHVKLVKQTIKQVNGRVPVIAGAGSNNTQHAIEMSKALSAAGADGLLLVTPYYNKCSQEGLVKHFEKIADSVDIATIIYSVPGRTGVNITPWAVSKLYEHQNICGIKEASGNIGQVVEMAKYITDDFAIYSGNDDMTIPIMSIGGSGVISTVANIIPKEFHNMVYNYINGNTTLAGEQQIQFKELIDAVFIDVNPIPIKSAMHMMGLIKKCEYRLPLCELNNSNLYKVRSVLQNYKLMPEDL